MLFSLFLALAGFLILSYSADKLVEGSSNLANRFGVSRLVIGMTIVAGGTSLPEMVVSVNASLKGNPELSLGNVVGSNIMNAALILGVAALIQPIKCQRKTIRREVPVMIGTAVLLWFVAYTGRVITPLEGYLFVALFFGYIGLSFYWSKKDRQSAQEIEEQMKDVLPEAEEPTAKYSFFLITGGLIGLTIGSESLVRGAVDIAHTIGVTDEIIGLTLIAIGTSLPELATAIVSASKGQAELSLGNVVGSNIFNVLGIVGCASFVSSFNVDPDMRLLNVSENMLGIHIPLMVAVSLGVLPIMSTGLRIIRAEGALLIAVFMAYNVVLFQTSDHNISFQPSVETCETDETVPSDDEDNKTRPVLIDEFNEPIDLDSRQLKEIENDQ